MTDQHDDSFAELFKKEEKKKIVRIQPGQKISAIIVGINAETTFLDVGGKSEGVLNTSELKDNQGEIQAAVGDRIEVYYLQTKSGEQLFTTSLSTGASHAHLEEAFRSAIPVEGVVKTEIKGGFEIGLGSNVRGFCPYSQMGLRRVTDTAEYLGKSMQFLITRFEENGRNLVLSARAIQERERQEQREQLIATLSEGQIVEGEISSIKDFGAFVDLGGADGLIPVSEIGWSRVENAADFFTIGQKVNVVIKALDWEKDRISLSYKETQADPWEEVVEKFPVGTTHQGTVVRLVQFGAFVSLAEGVDGLVHISKLGGGRRINHPREVLEEGQQVDITIESIDLDERRISLSPAEYVSPEQEEATEQSAYTSYLRKQKEKKKPAATGTLGALLQKKLDEKKR